MPKLLTDSLRRTSRVARSSGWMIALVTSVACAGLGALLVVWSAGGVSIPGFFPQITRAVSGDVAARTPARADKHVSAPVMPTQTAADRTSLTASTRTVSQNHRPAAASHKAVRKPSAGSHARPTTPARVTRTPGTIRQPAPRVTGPASGVPRVDGAVSSPVTPTLPSISAQVSVAGVASVAIDSGALTGSVTSTVSNVLAITHDVTRSAVADVHLRHRAHPRRAHPRRARQARAQRHANSHRQSRHRAHRALRRLMR